MRILIPVAAPISYNPAHYLAKNLREMGHEARVMDQQGFYTRLPSDADLFFGVDSGGPLNIPEEFLSKSVMWYIDYRRNYNTKLSGRVPPDEETALRLLNGGGLVFQAQLPDVQGLQNAPNLNESLKHNVHYLPLAAEPSVWASEALTGDPVYISAFVGNCYDTDRLGMLNGLATNGLLYWPGIEGAIMEDGAKVYQNALVGVNIPSFWGTPECYDVNMRVFEVLSCGRPLITNRLMDLNLLEILDGEVCKTYTELWQIAELIEWFNSHRDRAVEMGRAARALILRKHTYTHRAQQVLEIYNARTR